MDAQVSAAQGDRRRHQIAALILMGWGAGLHLGRASVTHEGWRYGLALVLGSLTAYGFLGLARKLTRPSLVAIKGEGDA